MMPPSPRSGRANSLWGIFRWPIVIAVASIGGLVSALVGNGWADVLSWLLLGGMIVVMAIAWRGGR